MPNRLIDETSPYLLQHADNPVDWYPWGDEALGRARAEDRPIFLSIGYSTCHWCHVMEREAFTDLFWDDSQHVFYLTSRAHELLVARPLDVFDATIPSGNSVAVDVLLRLAELTGATSYRRRAAETLEALAGVAGRQPGTLDRLLAALDFFLARPQEVAIVGEHERPDTRDLLGAVFNRYRPNVVVAGCAPGDAEAAQDIPLLAARDAVDAQATAYVCWQYDCQPPVTDPQALAALLEAGVGE